MIDRRFQVYDGDGELLRTFTTTVDALEYMEKRPEFVLKVIPKEKPTETEFQKQLRLNGEALL